MSRSRSDVTTVERPNVDAVYDRVRSAILRGELPPSHRISQTRLAQRLGVSRTPLRETLRRLQQEGLIKAEPNRQVQVAGLSLPDVEQIYATRLALEVMAARFTVPRLNPEELAHLHGTLAEMAHFAAVADRERWEVPHRTFHLGLVAKAGERTTGLISQLSDHAERFRRIVMRSADARARGWAEHVAILDAVAKHDVERTVVELSTHLSRTALGVMKLTDGNYDAALLMETVGHLTNPGVVRRLKGERNKTTGGG